MTWSSFSCALRCASGLSIMPRMIVSKTDVVWSIFDMRIQRTFKTKTLTVSDPPGFSGLSKRVDTRIQLWLTTKGYRCGVFYIHFPFFGVVAFLFVAAFQCKTHDRGTSTSFCLTGTSVDIPQKERGWRTIAFLTDSNGESTKLGMRLRQYFAFFWKPAPGNHSGTCFTKRVR